MEAKNVTSSLSGDRKRKSACLNEVFEVSDRDLSPEPPDESSEEPAQKILKIDLTDTEILTQNAESFNLKHDGNCANLIKTTCSKGDSEDIVDITSPTRLDNDVCVIIEDNSQTSVGSQTRPDIALCNDITDCNNESIDCKVTNEDPDICITNSNTELFDNSLECVPEQSPQLVNVEEGELLNETVPDNIDDDQNGHKSIITIQFTDKTIADVYKSKFNDFLKSFVELEVKEFDGTTLEIFKDSTLNPRDWAVVDLTEQLEDGAVRDNLSTPNAKKKKKKKRNLDDLFVVDIEPGINKKTEMKYSTKFSLDTETTKSCDSPGKKNFGSLCFNCEENHSLKDCPEPKNFGKIASNRQRFQTKGKPSRYHVEEEQKFNNLKPGKISQGLQKALGLKKNQIPSYVYQMRELGYPPGWLEEAKLTTSDLALFDIHGNNLRSTLSNKIKGLDPEKIVEYPGFNVPLEKGYKDEYKYHCVPPFGSSFSKENMIQYFKELAEKETDNLVAEDMELVVEVETESLQEQQENDTQLSLHELQMQKDSLLEEIKKSEETVRWDDSIGDNSQDLKEATSDIEEAKLDAKTSQGSETSGYCSSPASNKTVNSVKETIFGTPILKSKTIYDKLPEPENFTKGVSPVIDFENLPNSTGKYEQMSGVLEKVRNTLKQLQKPET